VSNAEKALIELIYRNPQRHDGNAYELDLALWGLGHRERPDAGDFGQDEIDQNKAMEYIKRLVDDSED